MATVFTSWTDLHTALREKYAAFLLNGGFERGEYTYDAGSGRIQVSYRTLDELEQHLTKVKRLAESETGAAVGRTYARPVRPR